LMMASIIFISMPPYQAHPRMLLAHRHGGRRHDRLVNRVMVRL
jgi:hypothetical protein